MKRGERPEPSKESLLLGCREFWQTFNDTVAFGRIEDASAALLCVAEGGVCLRETATGTTNCHASSLSLFLSSCTTMNGRPVAAPETTYEKPVFCNGQLMTAEPHV